MLISNLKSGLSSVLVVFVSISTMMCQTNKSESKLDLSQPDSTAAVFAMAFTNNDTTLFQHLVLNKDEFENFVSPWRGQRGAERGILEFTQIWQDSKNQFQKSRQEAISWLQNTTLGKTKYQILNSDIDPETGFIEFDFQIGFESNEQIGFRLYLTETANKLPISEEVKPSALTSIKNSQWKILGLRMD